MELVAPNLSEIEIVATQLASLAIEPQVKLFPSDTDLATAAPAKKNKKRVKVAGDKPVRTKKGTKKKKDQQGLQPCGKSEQKNPLELHLIDPNEPTKIRFRKYSSEDFRLITLLGTGGFGMVYLAKLVNHNAFFAVKFMEKLRVLECNDYESVLTEKKVMLYGNNNPFICRLFCSFQTKSHLCFAMEFCVGGDLRFHLDKAKRFSIDKVRFYLVEIICALRYLHKLGFIYRDLKLDNVMIAATGHIKLVDFGMCLGKIYRKEKMPSDFAGTLEYMAPEIIKAHKYNQSVDWWSLGVCGYEMSVGGYPFTGTDEDELCFEICNLNVTFPCFIPQSLQNLISQLLVKNAEERLGTPNSAHGKVTEHAFFADTDWSQAEQGRLSVPFLPHTKSVIDTSHFEEIFTHNSLPEPNLDFDLKNSSEQFVDFDYTNPNMTD